MAYPILEWSIRSMLLVVGTGLVLGVLRVRVPSAQHRAWSAAMVAMLLLPSWTQWGPSLTAPLLPAVQENNTGHPEISLRAVGVEPNVTHAAVAEPFQPAPRSSRPDWQQMLLIVYLAGVVAMLFRLILGTLQVRSLMRGVQQAEGFVTSPLCAAPVTMGWLRPVSCLPDNWRTWPAAKLEAVLIHEREHARRRDPLVQWLALLNRCIFWFHPLAWWLERKLAALAEEACDAAVLARGHAAQDYVGYLIELARSVNQTGARLRWAGTGSFSTGNLTRRVRQIVETPPVPALSRAKSVVFASLCALMLVTFLACSLGRRSSSVSRDGDALLRRQMRRQQSDASVWKAALQLTPDGAKKLEANIKRHPGDTEQLLELVRYYQSRKDLKALDALTLWFIAQHPEVRFNWGQRPEWDQVWDQEGYGRGRQLWTARLHTSWTSPFVYMNAAEFLSGNDNDQAEQALLEGQRKFPSSALHWEVLLAHHYAWALARMTGQPPQGPMALTLDEPVVPAAQGPYAQKVRQKLLASNDTELLTRTVEQLQRSRANMEFSKALIERVLSIEPDNRQAHLQRETLQALAIQRRAKADPGSLSDPDRMVLLQVQLRWPGVKDGETKAEELLALASHTTNDPNYGTAIFLANIALGEAAMKRGDRAAAVQHLLAVSDAPPTEYLRYNQIDLSLARKLVDSGERQAVATFLDRCAKFNNAGLPLAHWASQIRQGHNPMLAPNSILFRKAG